MAYYWHLGTYYLADTIEERGSIICGNDVWTSVFPPIPPCSHSILYCSLSLSLSLSACRFAPSCALKHETKLVNWPHIVITGVNCVLFLMHIHLSNSNDNGPFRQRGEGRGRRSPDWSQCRLTAPNKIRTHTYSGVSVLCTTHQGRLMDPVQCLIICQAVRLPHSVSRCIQYFFAWRRLHCLPTCLPHSPAKVPLSRQIYAVIRSSVRIAIISAVDLPATTTTTTSGSRECTGTTTAERYSFFLNGNEAIAVQAIN